MLDVHQRFCLYINNPKLRLFKNNTSERKKIERKKNQKIYIFFLEGTMSNAHQNFSAGQARAEVMVWAMLFVNPRDSSVIVN